MKRPMSVQWYRLPLHTHMHFQRFLHPSRLSTHASTQAQACLQICKSKPGSVQVVTQECVRNLLFAWLKQSKCKPGTHRCSTGTRVQPT